MKYKGKKESECMQKEWIRTHGYNIFVREERENGNRKYVNEIVFYK